MIHAKCFREPGTEAEIVAPDELHKHLDAHDCLLWVDVNDPSEDDIAYLANELHIHHLTAEDLLDANQRTKLERFGDHYHVALHAYQFVGDVLRSREVDVVFSDGWLLSVRHTETDELTGPVKEALTRFERQRDEARIERRGLPALGDPRRDRRPATSTSPPRSTNGSTTSRMSCSTQPSPSIPREIFTLRRSIVEVPPGRRPAPRGARAAPAQGGRVHRRRGDRASPGRLRPHVAGPRPDRIPTRAPHRTARRPARGAVEPDEPGHEADVVVGRDPDRVDAHRRHLRHELPAHARARSGRSAIRSRSRSWGS